MADERPEDGEPVKRSLNQLGYAVTDTDAPAKFKAALRAFVSKVVSKGAGAIAITGAAAEDDDVELHQEAKSGLR